MKRLLVPAIAMLSVVGCGPSGGGNDVTPPPSGSVYKFVVNHLQAPTGRKDLAIDLDGNQQVDNKLGGLVQILSTAGVTVQMNLDSAVTVDGTALMLLKLQASDLTNASDKVGATLYLAKKPSTPASSWFSGTAAFETDPQVQPATLMGRITSGEMQSNNPVTTKIPVSMTLKLALVGGVAPLSLTVNGAHIQFKVSGDGKQVMSGQLHGSIKLADLTSTVLPAVAELLNGKLATCLGLDGGVMDAGMGDGGGCDPAAMTIENLLDDGGGGCATAADYHVELCELINNSVIGAALKPDVRIFDKNNNYAPTPPTEPLTADSTPDSISLGIGFTAVGATFTE